MIKNKRIFLALASDITEENKSETKDDEDGSRKGSFGRLRQRVADYKQNSKAKTASNANLRPLAVVTSSSSVRRMISQPLVQG